MDLYQIIFGSMLTIAWFIGVGYVVREAMNTWKLVQFSCNKQCCHPMIFAVCPHGGTPTNTPCPHHNI